MSESNPYSPPTDPAGVRAVLRKRRRTRWQEEGIKFGLFFCAFLSVVTTVGIIAILTRETVAFLGEVPITEFLFGTEWTPLLRPRSFGILPLLCGTVLIVIGSALVALPLGLGSAIYLSEYAPDRARSIIKPVLEILAGIPTVVYGYFALVFVTPMLRHIFPSIQVFNALSAAIVVGVMILPMVASICEDSLRAVPTSLRQAGYALGATKFEVSTQVVVPAAMSGIFASFVLAVSRAIGETMAVTLAAGATPNLTLNPLESIQTMTAYIVQVSLGDTPADSIEYRTIFAVGALLFLITLVLNLFAHRIVRRLREVYE